MLGYKANNPAGYELSMGRWSRRLAPLFVQFTNIKAASRILDVGCGIGSLSFMLSEAFPAASITGLDYSQAFVDYARSRAGDGSLNLERGDAAALPYGDAQFDATLSLLVLNFVPAAEKAGIEMKRVTKPGGVVSAAIWDFKDGLTFLRVLANTAAVLDASGETFRSQQFSAPLTAPGELASAWSKMGLKDVAQTSLTIRMEFASFAPWQGSRYGSKSSLLSARSSPLLSTRSCPSIMVSCCCWDFHSASSPPASSRVWVPF